MRALFIYVHGRKATHVYRNCLAGLAAKKSGGTITRLHTWRLNGCCNRFHLSNFLGNSKVLSQEMLMFGEKFCIFVHKNTSNCVKIVDTFFFSQVRCFWRKLVENAPKFCSFRCLTKLFTLNSFPADPNPTCKKIPLEGNTIFFFPNACPQSGLVF